MALQPGHKQNFQTLLTAATGHDLALVECQHTETGQLLPVICAVNRETNGDVSFVPLAQLFLDNPYDFLMPPR